MNILEKRGGLIILISPFCICLVTVITHDNIFLVISVLLTKWKGLEHVIFQLDGFVIPVLRVILSMRVVWHLQSSTRLYCCYRNSIPLHLSTQLICCCTIAVQVILVNLLVRKRLLCTEDERCLDQQYFTPEVNKNGCSAWIPENGLSLDPSSFGHNTIEAKR